MTVLCAACGQNAFGVEGASGLLQVEAKAF